MEKLTGVVMEQTQDHVILLTSMGEFKRVRVSGRAPAIGEEVTISVMHKRTFRMPSRVSWIAMAAAILMLLVASPLLTIINPPPEAAVAYVSIDINPSVELTIGDRYSVMDARPFNTDGAKLLARTNLVGLKYDEAVASIKANAEKMGYLKKRPDSTVVVSVSLVADAPVNKISVEKTLLASANTIFTDNITRVAALQVPAGIRDAARKKGMSPGKYAVLIEAVNAGLPLTERDIQDKPISVAIANAGGEPDRIIDQVRTEQEFDVKEQQYLVLASQTDPETPVVASAETGAEVTADGEQITDDSKKMLIEPIRNTGGPEETAVSGRTTTKPAAAAAALSPASAAGSAKDGETAGPVVTAKPAPVPADPAPTPADDQKTDENYMGPDTPDNGGTGGDSDMTKVKPNF